MSPGQLRGGGSGGGAEGAPHFISKVLHLCDGVGLGKDSLVLGKSRTPTPRPANVPFLFKVFFLFFGCFFFFFPCGWGLVNFLKVLLNLGGESVAAQLGAPFPHLSAPLAASLSTSHSL